MSKLDKIIDKATTEVNIIEDVLKDYCKTITNEHDRNVYYTYWAVLLSKHENRVFNAGITDDTQIYSTVLIDKEGAELNSNIDYLSKYIKASDSICEDATLERINDTIYCQGSIVVVSKTNTAPTLEANPDYPVLLTKIADKCFIIDGNHRVNSGEDKAVIVPPILFIRSLTTLYEVYMYLMYYNLYDYQFLKVPMEHIINKTEATLKVAIGKRLTK